MKKRKGREKNYKIKNFFFKKARGFFYGQMIIFHELRMGFTEACAPELQRI